MPAHAGIHALHLTTSAAPSVAAPAMAEPQQSAATARRHQTSAAVQRPLHRPALSPNARNLARRFFLMTSGAEAAAQAASSGPEAAADAAAATAKDRSAAIRLLLAWLQEGSEEAAAERRKLQQQAGEDVATPAAAHGAIAASYVFEQSVLDRAIYVLKDLYHHWYRTSERPSRRFAGARAAAPGPDSTPAPRPDAAGPMGLREQVAAVEALAGGAVAMGLAFKAQHWEHMLELYKAMCYQADDRGAWRRGVAERAMGAWRSMGQQHVAVSGRALDLLLRCLRAGLEEAVWGRGAAGAVEEARRRHVAAALEVVDAELPPGGGALGQGGLPGGVAESLWAFMEAAVERRDWDAYRRLESALLSRTGEGPLTLPYELSCRVLAAAAPEGAGGGGGEDGVQVDIAARAMRALAAAEAAALADARQRAAAAAADAGAAAGPAPPPTNPRAAWWHGLGLGEEAGARKGQRVEREDGGGGGGEEPPHVAAAATAQEGGLQALLEAAVRRGDHALAAEVYSRIRQFAWREAPAPKAAAEGGEGAAPVPAIAALLPLALSRRDWPAVMGLVVSITEVERLGAGNLLPWYRRPEGPWRRRGKATQEVAWAASPYGGLGPLSEVLMASETDSVDYYTQLLTSVSSAARRHHTAPFGGRPTPFGPPLRAAARRADLAACAELLRQMRAFGCAPAGDAYAAVVEASLRGGKPERVAGLLGVMAEERVAPTPALWAVQLDWHAQAVSSALAAAAGGEGEGLAAGSPGGRALGALREAAARMAAGDGGAGLGAAQHAESVEGVALEVYERALDVAAAAEDEALRAVLAGLLERAGAGGRRGAGAAGAGAGRGRAH